MAESRYPGIRKSPSDKSGASLGGKEGKNYRGREAPARTKDSHLKRNRRGGARKADTVSVGWDFEWREIRRLRDREVGSSGGSELKESGGPRRVARLGNVGILETLGIGRLRASGVPKVGSNSTPKARGHPEPFGDTRDGAIEAAGQGADGSGNWEARSFRDPG